MIVDLLAAIAMLLLLAIGFVLQLERIEFGAGWLSTVRADGTFELRRQPRDFDHGDDPPGVLRGRVYCTGGSRAIAIDYRTVGCGR